MSWSSPQLLWFVVLGSLKVGSLKDQLSWFTAESKWSDLWRDRDYRKELLEISFHLTAPSDVLQGLHSYLRTSPYLYLENCALQRQMAQMSHSFGKEEFKVITPACKCKECQTTFLHQLCLLASRGSSFARGWFYLELNVQFPDYTMSRMHFPAALRACTVSGFRWSMLWRCSVLWRGVNWLPSLLFLCWSQPSSQAAAPDSHLPKGGHEAWDAKPKGCRARVAPSEKWQALLELCQRIFSQENLLSAWSGILWVIPAAVSVTVPLVLNLSICFGSY